MPHSRELALPVKIAGFKISSLYNLIDHEARRFSAFLFIIEMYVTDRDISHAKTSRVVIHFWFVRNGPEVLFLCDYTSKVSPSVRPDPLS